jgi:hypothetical protein
VTGKVDNEASAATSSESSLEEASEPQVAIELQRPMVEGPHPETIFNVRLDGSRKYIPVDGEELRGMLAAARVAALEDAADAVGVADWRCREIIYRIRDRKE